MYVRYKYEYKIKIILRGGNSANRNRSAGKV